MIFKKKSVRKDGRYQSDNQKLWIEGETM